MPAELLPSHVNPVAPAPRRRTTIEVIPDPNLAPPARTGTLAFGYPDSEERVFTNSSPDPDGETPMQQTDFSEDERTDRGGSVTEDELRQATTGMEMSDKEGTAGAERSKKQKKRHRLDPCYEKKDDENDNQTAIARVTQQVLQH